MNARASILLAVGIATGLLLPSAANADGIGEFGDSVERRERRERRPSAAQTQTTQQDPSELYDDDDPWLLFLLLWGMAPVDEFTFGGSPYRRRGWLTAPDGSGPGDSQIGTTGQGLNAPGTGSTFYESGDFKDPKTRERRREPAQEQSVAAYRTPIDIGQRRPRAAHLEIEGSPAWVLDAENPARGYSLWARLETTSTPAFSYTRSRFGDLRTDDTLSIDGVAIEPRWFMSRNLIIRAGIGWTFYTNQDGPINSAPTAGVSFSIFPGDPFLLDLRLGVQPFIYGPVNAELYAAIGVETIDSLFIVASTRVLANPQSTLTMTTVGLRFDFGF
jgi:hypothetical protein